MAVEPTSRFRRVWHSRGLRITRQIMKHLRVPVLCLIGLFAGLVIGYVILGKQPLSDVWKLSTWKHIYDLVFTQT